MSNKPNFLKGAGGGKGGGQPKEPTIHPDGLHSQALIEGVLAISEGPIAGPLHDSFQHVYLADTPVRDPNGQLNFETGSIRLGYNNGDELNPTPIPYHLKGSGIAYGVQAQLKQGEPVIRTTPAVRRGLFNRLEVILNIQRLMLSNTDGQMRTSFTYNIDYRPSGTTDWQPFPGSPFTVNDKTTTGARVEHGVRLATEAVDTDYDIRVLRSSKNSDTEYLADVSWEAYEVVLTHDQSATKRSHTDLAMMHAVLYSNDQFTRLPNISGIYGGLLVSLPTNYDPRTRTYDEFHPWDGTFTTTKHWTDNPFWLIRELVMNERFGMRKYQPFITLNDYDLYRLAKDADTMVGHPTVGPKYTFNGVLAEAKPGLETLRYIAGTAFANILDDGRGNLTVVAERAEPAIMLLTPESVVAPDQGDDITFQYSFTDVKERYNLINASYVNPNRGWDMEALPPLTLSGKPESQDPTIQRLGVQPLELELPGCIYEHEAHRKAVRILVEANTETILVSCALPMAGQVLQLGDIVALGDAEMGWGLTGRLKSIDGSTVHLHEPVYFEHPGTYTLRVQGYLDLEECSFEVTSKGELSSLPCSRVLEDIPPHAPFVIEHSDYVGTAQTFRVMSLDESQSSAGQYMVQLKLLNMDKFVAEEQAYFEGIPEPEAIDKSLTPPTNVQAEFVREMKDGEPSLRLKVTWDASPQALRYEVWAGPDTSSAFQMLGQTPTTDAWLDVEPNNYQLFVRAVGLFGTKDSAPVQLTLVKITAAHLAANATNVKVTERTTGFQRRDLHFNVGLSFAETYEGQTFHVDLFNLSTIKRAFVQIKDRPTGEVLRELDLPRTGVVYTYEQQLFDREYPSGKLDVELYLEDYLGDRFGPLFYQYDSVQYPEILSFQDVSKHWGLIIDPELTYDIVPRPNVRWFLSSQNSFATAKEVALSPQLQYLDVDVDQLWFVWGILETPFTSGHVFPSNTTGFEVRIPSAVQPPTKPTGVEVAAFSTWANISWDEYPSHGTGYTRIYRQETALNPDKTPVDPPRLDITSMLVAGSPTMMYHDTNLKSDRGYYYWVTHVNANGDEGPLHDPNGTFVVTVRNPSEILDEISGEISWDDLHPDTQKVVTVPQEANSLAGINNLIENARGQTRQRVNERRGLEKALGEVQKEAGERIAAIQAEAAARAADIQAEQGARAAAIQAERTARQEGDTALSNQITTLTSAVNKNVADILAEQTARADADSAMASDISALTATVNSNKTTTDAAILAEQTARADADSAMASDISALTATVNSNKTATDAAILAEQTARADADTAMANDISALTATVNSNKTTTDAAILAEQTARADADTAMANDISALTATVNSNKTTTDAAILAEQTARADADTAMANDISALTATVNSNKTATDAAILAEQTARADADTAMANDISALTATVNSNKTATDAAILAEQTARADANTAMANDISALTATVTGNKAATDAAIAAEQTARADAVSAMANQISSVSASAAAAQTTADGKGRLFYQSSAPTGSNRDAKNLWIRSTDNKPHRWDGTKWVGATDKVATDAAAAAAAAQGTADQAKADILAEQTARADADSALAQSVETVQSSLNGTQSTVQTLSQTVSTIDEQGSEAHKALWGVKASAGDVTAGIGLVAKAGGGSELALAAGKVVAFDPAKPTTKENLFVVEGGKVLMNETFIKQAYIDQLIANKVDAPYINTLDLNAVNISGGQINIGSGFSVDPQGNLVAHNADLRGTLQVPNACIDTLQLAGQAVTIPSAVASSSTFSTTTRNENNRVTVLTLTVTTTGNPVLITANAAMAPDTEVHNASYGRRNYYMTLDYDDNRIALQFVGFFTRFKSYAVVSMGNGAIALKHTPPAGTHTYKIKVFQTYDQTSAWTLDVRNRSLVALEVKR
ncbi:hypothetical protein PU634_10265 [Oceanimonas pelagia]|uniref:Fibronectin type-III domain-containing protein n=1 Tax=Oceanimonas pelagia TaxID=3028314 RepID=A0AA50KL86_9GAMM|nr:hypothetical protein [Oceanimonas pelagia]WMC09499.1 hypothetical protein PU634_10265 [Oceanimonas pelagia]